jgi:hypothetical protein
MFHKILKVEDQGYRRRLSPSKLNDELDSVIPSAITVRRFCRTEQGRYAWLSKESKLTDKFIIRGARIPFLVRPTSVAGEYLLVGECWIKGLMEGEALNLPGFGWEKICLV